jgi:menaquinone-dependent protoporphyrinogen IX oxidase
MSEPTKPRVLIVYYTFSQQTGRVAEVMAQAFTARGCEVTKALIEFTEPRWQKLFAKVPMARPVLEIPTIMPSQRRKKTGEIRIPQEAQEGDYDLVVIGSPTWWLTTNMPIRSYLKSPAARKVLDGKAFAAYSVSRKYWKGNMDDVRKLGEENGGRWVDRTYFVAVGNQVTTMLSWLAYMKRGEPKARLLGVKLPPPNLKPDFEQQAQGFVDKLADRVLAERSTFGSHTT